MATATPTTSEISSNIVASLQSSLSQTIPILPRSFIRVLAKALAGIYVILYKYIGFTLLQQFVSTASFTATQINGRTVVPLIEWGRLIGVGDPVSATRAELTIDVTVRVSGSLPSGTQLLNTATGVIYITLSAVTLTGSTVQADVRAVSDQSGTGGAGTQGNMSVGEELQFVNPIPQVERIATVAAQTTTAADAESESAYRQRVIDRFQKPLQGGAYADYEAWGEEVAGIINVYPYTGDPGEVNVYSEATVASSGSADGIPTQAQLDAVLASIEQSDRRPANAFVNSLPITRTGFDVTVQGLDNVADTTAVQDQIETALTEYFAEREPFIPGLSVPPSKASITLTGVGGVVDGIVQIYGGVFELLTVEENSNSVSIYPLDEGEKAKLASISFV